MAAAAYCVTSARQAEGAARGAERGATKTSSHFLSRNSRRALNATNKDRRLTAKNYKLSFVFYMQNFSLIDEKLSP
jgi:hypothetical protein